MTATDTELLTRVGAMFDAIDPAPPVDVSALAAAASADMRAWTVHQPWATAIVGEYGGNGGPKDTENRPKQTHRRGLVLIHAARPEAFDLLAGRRNNAMRRWINSGALADCGTPASAIIGTAVITGCHQCDGSCSEWAEPDAWHCVLGERRALQTPVPCLGALGFWRPDVDTLAAVLDQLAAVSA